MKILLVANHLNTANGWGTSARNTALGLAKAGHELRILVHEPSPDLPFVQVQCLPRGAYVLWSPFTLHAAACAIRAHAKEFQPDIVHVATDTFAMVIPFFRKFVSCPVTFTACGTYSVLPLMQWWTYRTMLRAYRETDGVLAISTYTQERILTKIAEYDRALAEEVRAKTSIISLGIELPSHIPEHTTHATKQILHVGGVKERKGVLELIRACGIFLKSGIPFHVHIVGTCTPGNYLDAVHADIERLHLTDHVTIHGRMTDEELGRAYADCDVFIMPSQQKGAHFEGFGLVFLEANAYGAPVIGPANSGCTDAISQGVSGYTVDCTNPHTIADHMELILGKQTIKRKDCQEWAQAHGIERQAKDMEAAYSSLLKRHKSRV